MATGAVLVDNRVLSFATRSHVHPCARPRPPHEAPALTVYASHKNIERARAGW